MTKLDDSQVTLPYTNLPKLQFGNGGDWLVDGRCETERDDTRTCSGDDSETGEGWSQGCKGGSTVAGVAGNRPAATDLQL
ncbi:unnamed protein product [Citrullus colocynthis]|uniref:Uncharacterized protein n=1 Tax=Citrullus colocynthis TaxID=252529 RepID=A0ABP0XSQ8_9ROSI